MREPVRRAPRRIAVFLYVHAGVWFGFFALEAILPMQAATGTASAARAWCLAYALVSTLAAWLVDQVWREPGLAARPTPARATGTRRLSAALLLSAGLAVGGTLLQAYDKVLVQGIDYSGGVALARYAWVQAAESRGGAISSPASAVGNLLAPMFVVTLVLVVLQWEAAGRRLRWLALGGALVSLAGTSALTGGRSVLLVALGAGVAAAAVRRADGLGWIPGARGGGPRSAVVAAGTAVLALGWFGYVFAQRASANNLDVKFYVDLLLPRLNATPTGTYEDLGQVPGPVRSMAYLVSAIGVYAVHGLYTFQRVLSDVVHPGTFLGAYPGALAYKLHLIAVPPAPFQYEGLFLPLPGAIYYDFGWGGLLLGALVHGFLLGGAMVAVRGHRGNWMTLGYIVGVLATSVISPITVSFNLLIFPFAMIAFGLLALPLRAWYGRHGWSPPRAAAR